MEDLIAAYPKDFFPRKDLVLKGRQGSFSGVGRFDLLFEDEHGTNVLMELKAVTAKYEHADQLGKYWNALVQRGERNILMWLVAPDIPGAIREFMDRIGIEYTEIHEAQYRDVARRRDFVLEDRSGQATVITRQPATPRHTKSYTRTTASHLPAKEGNAPRELHPTPKQSETPVVGTGDEIPPETLLEDMSPYNMIQEWIRDTQTKDGQRLFHHVNGDYYKWTGGLYRKVEQEEIRQEWYPFFSGREVKVQQARGLKISTICTDKKLMTNLDDAARSLCYVRVEDGVHEPFLIATGRNTDLARAVVFQNGILDVTTDELTPLSPDIFLTSTLPYEYAPGFQCEKWRQFVDNVFNGDEECVALLQEWFGYNLIASNHMQAMMFFFGVPGSGKSTTGNILRALLGDARACAVGAENFTGQFGRAKLVGKYAAIMSESRGTNKSDIDKLLQTWKAMIGGDVMDIRAMYKPHADARLFSRLTYIANDAIQFNDAAQAMANRLLLLYFPNNYRKLGPDWNLEEKLRAEIPGIALWALEGLKRLLKNGRFTRPKVSAEHLQALAELTNPIGMMLKECCEIHTGPEFIKHCVPCSDLYDLWRVWSERNNVRLALNSISFGMKLGKMDLPIVKRQMTEHKKRFYVYQGLSFQPGIMEKYLMR